MLDAILKFLPFTKTLNININISQKLKFLLKVWPSFCNVQFAVYSGLVWKGSCHRLSPHHLTTSPPHHLTSSRDIDVNVFWLIWFVQSKANICPGGGWQPVLQIVVTGNWQVMAGAGGRQADCSRNMCIMKIIFKSMFYTYKCIQKSKYVYVNLRYSNIRHSLFLKMVFCK